MKKSGKIVLGIAFLLFGIGWMLEITNVINITYEGWWTIFIIIPSLVGIFVSKHKTPPIIGLGTGVLLLLSARGIVPWSDFWKYLLCLMAIVWGFALIFSRKSPFGGSSPDKKTVNELKQINQDGRMIRQINISFGKQIFEFSGMHFEGATVENNFGFVSLDLRSADILDGAVIDVDCNFGGMEIRVDNNIQVKHAVDSSFGGVEYNEKPHTSTDLKTLYVKGKCTFGGIEIK